MQLRSFNLIPSPGRRGFSFVELLFAVLILGIGLIMIAAIFPVGIEQTKANLDSTQAAAIGRTAVGQLSQSGLKTDYPAYNSVIAMQSAPNSSNLQTISEANAICAADPRYAWAGMYYRPDANSNYAQVLFIIGNRSDPYNTTNDLTNLSNGVHYFEPRSVNITLTTTALTVNGTTAANASNGSAVAPGAFVVVSSFTPASTDLAVTNSAGGTIAVTAPDKTAAQTKLPGLIYRVGEPNGTALGFFPGYEFQPVKFSYFNTADSQTHYVTILQASTATGFVLGRNRIATTGGAGDFDGPVQDVAYYTSFISLK